MSVTWLGTFYQQGNLIYVLCLWVITAGWTFPLPRILLLWSALPILPAWSSSIYFPHGHWPMSILLKQYNWQVFKKSMTLVSQQTSSNLQSEGIGKEQFKSTQITWSNICTWFQSRRKSSKRSINNSPWRDLVNWS